MSRCSRCESLPDLPEAGVLYLAPPAVPTLIYA